MGLLWVGLAAHATRAETLTLEAALARGRDSSPVLASARADVASAEGRLRQAGLIQANPILTTGGTHHSIGPHEVNNDAAVSLGQEVEIGGQRGLRIDAARYDVEHAEDVLADKARAVDAEIRRAFAGLVAGERRVALARDAAAAAQRLADATDARVAHGDAGRVELDLARLDAMKTREDAAAAELDLTRAAGRLATALAADADEPLAATAADAPVHETPAEATVVGRALGIRPDLAAARAQRAQLEGQADLTRRTGLVPNPTFRGFYSHENGIETLAGGEIEVPLPVWNRQQGAETDLRSQAAGAAVEVARLAREIQREVRLALAHHRLASAAWERYRREALPAADAARASLARALDGGYLSLTDVLTQTARLRDTRRAAVDAWLDLREAEADVIEAVGESPW
jgi:outer membrane protein, heavy metal efflux system